jgi:hypothetical protein
MAKRGQHWCVGVYLTIVIPTIGTVSLSERPSSHQFYGCLLLYARQFSVHDPHIYLDVIFAKNCIIIIMKWPTCDKKLCGNLFNELQTPLRISIRSTLAKSKIIRLSNKCLPLCLNEFHWNEAVTAKQRRPFVIYLMWQLMQLIEVLISQIFMTFSACKLMSIRQWWLNDNLKSIQQNL